MKLIKTAVSNHYINADAILELYIDKGGEIISEEHPDCYKIMATMQAQSYPIVLGTYATLKAAENSMFYLTRNLSSAKPYEMRE